MPTPHSQFISVCTIKYPNSPHPFSGHAVATRGLDLSSFASLTSRVHHMAQIVCWKLRRQSLSHAGLSKPVSLPVWPASQPSAA